jgi:hypothetical protein
VEERVISKRGLIVAGALGTGSVLLAAGSALACNISDFQFNSTVSCDTSSGSPMATIKVTDNDSSGTAAVIDIFTRNADGSNGTKVATLNFPDNQRGESQTASLPWVDNGSWNVVAETNRYIKTPETSKIHLSTGSQTCAVEKPTQSATPTPTASAPAAPVAATSAPATPAPSQSSPGTVLAETGGGSNTGLIGGFAAALVVVGGGVLYTVRRRAAAARHN